MSRLIRCIFHISNNFLRLLATFEGQMCPLYNKMYVMEIYMGILREGCERSVRKVTFLEKGVRKVCERCAKGPPFARFWTFLTKFSKSTEKGGGPTRFPIVGPKYF